MGLGVWDSRFIGSLELMVLWVEGMGYEELGLRIQGSGAWNLRVSGLAWKDVECKGLRFGI